MIMTACCYARTSTFDQAREEKASIPDQIKWAREFAASRGWEFTEEYIEPGVFGDVEFEDREAATRLLNDAVPLGNLNRKFDIVLVYHSSRLAREADLVLRFHRILAQRYRIQVHMRNAPIEPMEPSSYYWGGNFIQQVTAALAGVQDQQENVTRGERVRSGFQGLARNGKLTFAPYGYKKISEIKSGADGRPKYTWHFEFEPAEALIVKEIFSQYVYGGASIRGIMFKLNEKAIPSPSGRTGVTGWSPASIKNTLNNPAYIGLVRWGRKLGSKYKEGKSVNGKQKRVFAPPGKWILVKGDQPPIIDELTFNKAQERLKLRGILPGRAIASDGLLTGLVWCGICQKRCYFKTRRAKTSNGKPYVRSDYICQTHIRFGKDSCRRYVIAGKKLDSIVTHDVQLLIKQAKRRNKLFLVDKKNRNSEFKESLAIRRQEELQLQEANRKILEAYEKGILNLTGFGTERARLDKAILIEQEEIGKIEQQMKNTELAKEAKVKFVDLLTQFAKKFDKADLTARKDLVHGLIEEIVIGKNGRVQLNYRI